ncbi:hypothetical protein DENSPDRAFT_839721 [Dentipellis sp. KUC8613]|nr:hypothetical protein DENSPDRAFT_839721 [Dentipellis sp. KUC8613]
MTSSRASRAITDSAAAGRHLSTSAYTDRNELPNPPSPIRPSVVEPSLGPLDIPLEQEFPNKELLDALQDALQEPLDVPASEIPPADLLDIAGDQDKSVNEDARIHPSIRKVFSFRRPDESQIRNLYDLVYMALPVVPNIYSKGKLEDTRQPGPADFSIKDQDCLKDVMFRPDLLTPIQAPVAARLRDIPIDWSHKHHREFAMRILPWFTAFDNPKRIYSEGDTEDWVFKVLIRPAMAIMHAVRINGIPEEDDSSYPFFSSSHGILRCKPDGVVVNAGAHPCEDIALCVEVKTDAVLGADPNPMGELAEIPKHPNASYKFNWPHTPESAKGLKESSAILTQIWTQVVKWDAPFGILSSLDLTYFYVRKGTILYISQGYKSTQNALFLAVCWLLRATQTMTLPRLILPKPDRSWWKEGIRKSIRIGILSMCFLAVYVKTFRLIVE